MSQIQVNVRFPRIPADNLPEFKRVAAEALELAKGEAGTVNYTWFFNDDETSCVVLETYEDSASVLAHVANLGDVFGRLVEAGGGCSFQMFGEPSAELLDATRGLDLTVFRCHQGK